MSGAAELCASLRRLALLSSPQSRQCCSQRTSYLSLVAATSRSISIPSSRTLSTSSISRDASTTADPIKPAAPLDIESFVPNQGLPALDPDSIKAKDLTRLRVVPASPSYFGKTPTFTDDYLVLARISRKYAMLPRLKPGETNPSTWIDIGLYRNYHKEQVKATPFKAMMRICRSLSLIMPEVMPEEVTEVLKKFRRAVDPPGSRGKPILLDDFGRARAVGRRKTSTAVVWLVEGDGQIMVNGNSLSQAFARVVDREAAIWGLKATNRLDKYNVFGLVKGGGTTGQAEALTLALARALLVHEPALKPVLRKAGVMTRDPRMVERKKPGRLKARKMPTWVKR